MRARLSRSLGVDASPADCEAAGEDPSPQSSVPMSPSSPSAHSPRTLTGKRPSAASLQREHEYMDWVNNLPYLDWLERPDRSRDESYQTFMVLRRGAREDARRKGDYACKRQQRQDHPSAAALQRRREHNEWLLTLQDLPDRKKSWAKFMKQRRQQQQQQRNESRRKSTKLGRPINPLSKRQQRLAAKPQRRGQSAACL